MPPNPRRDANCLNKFKNTVRETIQNMKRFFTKKNQQAQAALQNVNASGFDSNAGRDGGVDLARDGLPSYTESMNPLHGLPKYSQVNEGPHLPGYDAIWDNEGESMARIVSVGSLTREEIDNQTEAWEQLRREQSLERAERERRERRLDEAGGYFEDVREEGGHEERELFYG